MSSYFGRRAVAALPLGFVLAVAPTAAFAQPPGLPTPSAPAPAVPPTVSAAEGANREAVLEDRVKQLEAMVNRLAGQVQTLSATPGRPAAGGPAAPSSEPMAGTAPGEPTNTGAPEPNASAAGGAPSQPAAPKPAAPGQSLGLNPGSLPRFDSPPVLDNVKANAKFGPGFELRSEDEEFIFQFHNLTQIDYRGYQQGGQVPVHDTFGMPRQWFMFSGRITKPVGYFVSLAHGFDATGLLDAFIDLNYNPKVQARIGRFKTPFTYEFLIEPVQGMMLPERSVFFNNFGQNRDIGAMAYGRVAGNTLDYAFGVFNGNRNGFLANQDSKFVSGLLNWKPWVNDEGSVLENFNVGGSLYTGSTYNSPVIPQVLRTAVPTAGNAIVGVPFLTFNNNVRETGNQAFWDLHAAWYYKSLAVLGEWGSGAQGYALTSTPYNRTRLGVQSFYVQAGYLLTGETRSSMNIVKPLQPFDLRKGQRGPGAWEVVTRYQHLSVGKDVFTNGLADQNNWSNSLYITELGLNWHLTQYMKLYFDWEHAVFGDPVLYAPGKRQLTSDLFMVRFQLYF